MTYEASCHCGEVRCSFATDKIERAARCNCSICIRRGSILSHYVTTFELLKGDPTLYQWGDHMVKFWFCKICGIHVFSEVEGPRYRVNLGCVEGLDALALPVDLLDGRSL